MSASVFVDTNVLIYSEDGRDPDKQQAALRWLDVLWQRGCGRLSTQTLSEFYVNATRKIRPGLAPGEARAKIRRFAAWQPWQIDQATLESAWAVESRFGLHFWDAWSSPRRSIWAAATCSAKTWRTGRSTARCR